MYEGAGYFLVQLLINTHRFSFSVGPTRAATILSVLVIAALGSFGKAFFRASIMPIFVRSLPWISRLNSGSWSSGTIFFGPAGFDAAAGVEVVFRVFNNPFMVRCVSGVRSGGFMRPLFFCAAAVVDVATASDGVQYCVEIGSIERGYGSKAWSV